MQRVQQISWVAPHMMWLLSAPTLRMHACLEARTWLSTIAGPILGRRQNRLRTIPMLLSATLSLVLTSARFAWLTLIHLTLTLAMRRWSGGGPKSLLRAACHGWTLGTFRKWILGVVVMHGY